MTDKRRKLARELLAAATPGPWTLDADEAGYREVTAPDEMYGCFGVANCYGPNQDSDARLIAAAPDLLSEALDELDRRDREDQETADILDELGL